MDKKSIKKIVREGYAKIAKQDRSCCIPVDTSTAFKPCPKGQGSKTPLSITLSKPRALARGIRRVDSCCPNINKAEDISKKIGYTEEELKAVAANANLGLGCGNPIALASLKEGETVLDLGSGAGFDCFLAARKVGRDGRVIGVDMTPEMIEKARENARKGNYENVEFRLGEIETLPVTDNSVDIVISNCVINLSPDKSKVFKEAFRVLKPGGRLIVSDIVLLKELPDVIKHSIEAYVGCLSGAMMKAEYLKTIKEAGFQDIRIIDESVFPIECMVNDPTAKAIIENMKISAQTLEQIANSIISIKIYGNKPINLTEVKRWIKMAR